MNLGALFIGSKAAESKVSTGRTHCSFRRRASRKGGKKSKIWAFSPHL